MNISFYISLIFIIILVKFFNANLDIYFKKFISFFGPKAFPLVTNEFNKFALIRILFGLVLIWRGFSNLDLFILEDTTSAIGAWQIAEIVAGFLITFGLLTQFAFIFLILFMWHLGDGIIKKATLGNDIAAMLALFLMLVNSGRFLSIDFLLLNSYPKFHKFLLYSKGFLSYQEVFLSKFIVLTAYWAVCVYSVTMHLDESSWLDGTAGPLLLSNNFMATFHEATTYLFTNFSFSVYLAKVSLWIMMFWYPLVLPFVLIGGFFRKYIIIWGYLFFILSLVFLQLGYLAEVEFLLWFGLFWSSFGINKNAYLDVYYDDRCNLCDKTIQLITLIDIFGIVKLKPLSKNSKQLEQNFNLTKDAYLNDLYGVDHKGFIYGGYDFYLKLSKKVLVLWVFYPILLLLKYLSLGPLLYQYIAKKRIQWFGVCVLKRKKYINSVNSLKLLSASKKINFFHKVFTIHILVLTFFYLTHLFIQNNNKYIGKLAVAAHIYGITPINVFNASDLRMAENWFTIHSLENDALIPLLNEDGSRVRDGFRLEMHKSDRIYFGHTLRIRRNSIGNKYCFFDKEFAKIKYLAKVYISNYELKPDASGFYNFKFNQYFQKLPDHANLLENIYSPQEKKLICSIDFAINKN